MRILPQEDRSERLLVLAYLILANWMVWSGIAALGVLFTMLALSQLEKAISNRQVKQAMKLADQAVDIAKEQDQWCRKLFDENLELRLQNQKLRLHASRVDEDPSMN